MKDIYPELASLVEEINQKHNLEIELDTVAEIYGEDVVESLSQDVAAFEEKINWLLEKNFSDTVSDLCNRFGILFVECSEDFISKFEALIESLGDSYVDKIGEDLSLLEPLL